MGWDGMVLKINKDKINERLGERRLVQGFVFKINRKHAYYGEFWSALSSASPDTRIKNFFIDDFVLNDHYSKFIGG
jgi:hypothetical protein